MPFWTPATIWKDETVVIVGGGRSLLGFDWSLIKKYTVLGCNHAFKKLPHGIADANVSCDPKTLYDNFDALAAFPGIVFLNHAEQKTLTERNCPPWAYSIDRYLGGGLHEKGLSWNGHTGAAAINLALICGASRVYLLGYDMKADDPNNPDWYKDNSWSFSGRQAVDTVFTNWLTTFPRIERDRKVMFPDAEIINVNDDSAIEDFQKMSIANFIEIAREAA